jgi:hypothetical protein
MEMASLPKTAYYSRTKASWEILADCGYKSIHNFLDTHPNSTTALTITENPFDKEKPIRNIPLYGLEAWLKDREKF